MPLSFGQYQGLFWTAIVASLVSLAGSSVVVWNTQKKRKHSIQQRLLLSLSINDLFSSFNTMTVMLMVPKGTPNHWWAIGNTTTCTISGFLTMLFFLTTTCYNAGLSIYYVLTVRYGFQEDDFKRTKEIFVQVFIWVFSLTFAILGVVFNGYNPKIIVNICFLDSCSIQDMVDSGACPDSKADVLAGAYIIAIATLAFISLASTGIVYYHVRKKITGTDGTQSFHNLTHSFAKEQLRYVSSQAVGYAAIYLNLLFWQAVLVILSFGEEWAYFEGEGQAWFYSLQLLSWIFIPGQGLLNCIIYTRPKYIKWKKSFPDAGFFFWYWNALQMQDPPNRSASTVKAVSWRPTSAVAPPNFVATGDPELVGISSFEDTMASPLPGKKQRLGRISEVDTPTHEGSTSKDAGRSFWKSDYSLDPPQIPTFSSVADNSPTTNTAPVTGSSSRRLAMDGSIMELPRIDGP